MGEVQTQNKNLALASVEEAKARIENVRQTLYRTIIGREETVDAVILALIAKEHVAIIGPPGTAKSYLAQSLSRLIQAQFYAYLMTKFTTYDELFGPIDVVAFVQNSELRRMWSAIVSSDIVFLDEIFKASSAILNALLSLMQERVVYDPISGHTIKAKLWTLIAASNEAPIDEELQALYDRFAVRVFTQYLNDDVKLLSALMAKWQSNGATIQPLADMEDVKTLHEYATALLSREKDVVKLYHVNVVPLIKTLRTKGIIISDRSIIEKLPKLYAAYLTLHGVTPDNIVNAAYDIVLYAARTPQELNDIKKAVDESLGEVAELSRRLEQGKQLLRVGNLHAALEAFREVVAYDVSRITSRPWLKPRVEALISSAQDYIKRTQEIIQQIRALQESA